MTNLCYPAQNLLTSEQAKALMFSSLPVINDSEAIPIAHALNRILQQSVFSPIAIPHFRQSAMDGYAVSSAQLSGDKLARLTVCGTSWAGKPYTGQVPSRQCLRIFTGALIPDDIDSVIAQEQVNVVDGYVEFPAGLELRKNIREAGSDVEQGERLLTAPHKLSARDLSLLAAAGIGELSVKRRIKIGFFSNGDELVPLGQTLQPGQIYDSNRYLLAGLLSDAHYQVSDLGVIPDHPARLEQTLNDAASRFDVLISTGGASVGDADYVKQTLERCGQVNFWKLAIKPGKPLTFGTLDRCMFFGLPGNPIAVLVTFEQFVKPALLRMTGIQTKPIRIQARCSTPLKKSPGREEFQRGVLSQDANGEFTVASAGRQDSHQLKVASLANCFIVLDSGFANVEAGQMVNVEPFDHWL